MVVIKMHISQRKRSSRRPDERDKAEEMERKTESRKFVADKMFTLM